MDDMPNFPDDPRLKDLPDQIRNRFRGRSVPSQGIALVAEPKPVDEFLVAKTVIPINLSLKAGVGQEIFLAATDWVVQAITLRSSDRVAVITLAATEDLTEATATETITRIFLNQKKPITTIEGFEEISFIVKAGEAASLKSNVDVVLLGSIELVQESGKTIRTRDPV